MEEFSSYSMLFLELATVSVLVMLSYCSDFMVVALVSKQVRTFI